jgi:DNA-binding NarL/FixJ family response regulator
VQTGEVFIQPEIASRALRAALHPADGLIEPLSDREREVLVMLAQGIANKLHIAEGTVKNHVSNILGKLQPQNRTHAADIARKRGLN